MLIIRLHIHSRAEPASWTTNYRKCFVPFTKFMVRLASRFACVYAALYVFLHLDTGVMLSVLSWWKIVDQTWKIREVALLINPIHRFQNIFLEMGDAKQIQIGHFHFPISDITGCMLLLVQAVAIFMFWKVIFVFSQQNFFN